MTNLDELYRGGPWYVVDFRKMEFLRRAVRSNGKYGMDPEAKYATWTPATKHAMRYRNPSAAARMAGILNRQRGRNDCLAVTRAAAECLAIINAREGLPETQ